MAPSTAEVAVFSGLRGPARTFTYGIPDGQEVRPGHLIRVGLGPRSVAGVVLGPGAEAPATLRDIEGLVHPVPVLRSYQLELARWIAERYRSGLADAVRAMVPPGLAARSRRRLGVMRSRKTRRIPLELALTEDDSVRDAPATAAQRDALAAIERSLDGGARRSCSTE